MRDALREHDPAVWGTAARRVSGVEREFIVSDSRRDPFALEEDSTEPEVGGSWNGRDVALSNVARGSNNGRSEADRKHRES